MFCVFYFIKISKFALPGVMLIYERTSKDRKKEMKRITGIDMQFVQPEPEYSEGAFCRCLERPSY